MASDEVIQTVVITSVNGDVPVLEEALSALELSPSSYASLETGKANTFLVEEDLDRATELASQVREYLGFWNDMLSAPVEIEVQEMHKEDWPIHGKRIFIPSVRPIVLL